MILEIKKFPDKILRKKGAVIKEVDREIKELAHSMVDTMYFYKGVGLAAPQVGESKRIVVVDIGDGPEIYLNPKIVKKSGKAILEEGCLSFPDIFLNIKRAHKIQLEALSLKGRLIKKKVEGIAACVLQHEIDHLDGILMIDRLSLGQKIQRRIKDLFPRKSQP